MVEKEDLEKHKESCWTWASVCHFSALLGMVWWIPLEDFWMPVGQIIAPLGVWLFKRGMGPFVDLAGREALNFQINVTAVGVAIGLLLGGILSWAAVLTIVVLDIYFIAKAGVATSYGKIYTYNLKLIKIFPTGKLLKKIEEDVSA